MISHLSHPTTKKYVLTPCLPSYKEIRISHVFHEQNMVADGLANLAASKCCDWIEFDGPPVEVSSAVRGDDVGASLGAATIVSRH